jgi:hypothetical protein
MENLLKTVTECLDRFSEKFRTKRLAAIIGGEAVILHGIPRTTIDSDMLLHFENQSDVLCREFVSFLQKELGIGFEIKYFRSSKDLTDPIRHDLIIITDTEKRFKKLDILIANYKWEIEGLCKTESPYVGTLRIYPKVYLVGMKLIAGGAQDDEDIRNLFLIMSESEKQEAFQLAKMIRRDRNLSEILNRKRRNR